MEQELGVGGGGGGGSGGVPTPVDELPSMREARLEFWDELDRYYITHCQHCRRAWFAQRPKTQAPIEPPPGYSHVQIEKCRDCSKSQGKHSALFHFTNDMDLRMPARDPTYVGNQPQVSAAVLAQLNSLPALTQVEEMLIALVQPVMKVYRLCGGQLGYRGNTLCLPKDPSKLARLTMALPHTISDLKEEIFVIRKRLHSGQVEAG